MALEDLQAYPALQGTPVATLSSQIPQLYGFGGPPLLPSPPSNPCGHSIPSSATTLWLWRTSRPSQPSQQPLCPLYPHISPNFMTLEDLQASPVLQATLMPTLSSRIPRLYGFGGSPGLASPPSNPSARSIPSTATTLWLWRSSRPTQSSKQPLWPLYPLNCHNSMALEDL